MESLGAADSENPPPDDACAMVSLLPAASSRMDPPLPAASSLMDQLFAWHLEEILQDIFLGLDAESLKNARLVNSEWNNFIRYRTVGWRRWAGGVGTVEVRLGLRVRSIFGRIRQNCNLKTGSVSFLH